MKISNKNYLLKNNVYEKEKFCFESHPYLPYVMKKNFLTALNGNLDSSLVQEAKGLIESANSEDHREAVKAFIEKREPTFKGS